jgi:hypothetical protein
MNRVISWTLQNMVAIYLIKPLPADFMKKVDIDLVGKKTLMTVKIAKVDNRQ